MAILKAKDIRKMTKAEINEKVKELRMELIKTKVAASKGGKLKIKEIKRTIARLLTISKLIKEDSKESSSKPKKVLKAAEKKK